MGTRRYFATGPGLTVVLSILLACAPPSPTAPTPTGLPPVSPTASLVVMPIAQPSATSWVQETLPTPSQTSFISDVPLTPAASSTPSADLSQTYTATDGFWSIRYPASWKVRRSRSEPQFRPTDGSPAFLGVSLHVKVRALEPFVGSILELLRNQAPDFQTIEQGMTLRGWAPAARVTYRCTADGVERRGMLVCWTRYRIGYVVLAEGPTADWRLSNPRSRP